MAGVEGNVKVIGTWPSPFVVRTRIALKLKGVKYEFLEEVNFWTKSELLLKSNPVYKKVPVLLHDGKPICESLITVQYIDDVWDGLSILPSNPYDNAIARFWAAYLDDKLWPSLTGIIMTQAEETRAEAVSQVFATLQLLEGAFEKGGKDKAFFGRDSVGYLDIAFGSYLGWIKASEKMTGVKLLDEAKTPLLAAWAEHFTSDAAVKEVVPETDKLIEFAKVLQAKFQPTTPAN